MPAVGTTFGRILHRGKRRAHSIRGNGNLRPETLAETKAQLAKETVEWVWETAQPPAEQSGSFKPLVLMPIRGDWLVELMGIELAIAPMLLRIPIRWA
jgi:hypothetical protein